MQRAGAVKRLRVGLLLETRASDAYAAALCDWLVESRDLELALVGRPARGGEQIVRGANAHWLGPDLVRTNQPSPRQLAYWKNQLLMV